VTGELELKAGEGVRWWPLIRKTLYRLVLASVLLVGAFWLLLRAGRAPWQAAVEVVGYLAAGWLLIRAARTASLGPQHRYGGGASERVIAWIRTHQPHIEILDPLRLTEP